jgi:hypothetical protein
MILDIKTIILVNTGKNNNKNKLFRALRQHGDVEIDLSRLDIT